MDSEKNITNTPLENGETWNGTFEYVGRFKAVSLSCKSDTDCTIKLHFTNTEKTILHMNEYEVKAGIVFHIFEGVKTTYFRASVVNDSGEDQTELVVGCMYTNNSRDQMIVKLDATGMTVDISGQVVDISGQTVNIGTMPEITVDVSGVATEATLLDTYNLLNNNTSTGGLNVSLTALDGEKITNTLVDTKRGLDCNIINNELAVNVISGFATETTLGAIDTKLSEELTVNVISGFATEETLGAVNTKLGAELSVNVISGFATEETLGAVNTKLGAELSVNVISGFATEETLLDTYNLLNNNTSTGGLNVSLTALDGEKITNTVVDTKRGLDVNVINTSLNVEGTLNTNVLQSNSVIYDLTDNGPTLTGGDNRYESDRNRPDSWAYSNTKSQLGSSLYWYANSSTSPQGVQQFNITKGMIDTLYSVVSINKTTANADTLPIMGLYSPSNSGFFTSRWVFTIDPSSLLLQNEKVLLYWNNDPIDIHPNLRHVQLLFNAGASQGPLLSSEIVYLMSFNAPSAQSSGAISYNIYATGFVLNNNIHNEFQFTSGIQSKGDLVLSKLNLTDGSNLDVAVRNSVGITNTSLSLMTFNEINQDGTNLINGLNVITRNAFYPTTVLFTENDISITDETPSIDLRAYNKLSVFGNSTHIGGGSHSIIIQYSNDNITFYDSPNVIASTGGKFSYDNSTFCVSYIRFRFQVQIQTLTFIVSLK